MNTKNAPKNYIIDNIKKTKIISPNAKGKIKVGDFYNYNMTVKYLLLTKFIALYRKNESSYL